MFRRAAQCPVCAVPPPLGRPRLQQRPRARRATTTTTTAPRPIIHPKQQHHPVPRWWRRWAATAPVPSALVAGTAHPAVAAVAAGTAVAAASAASLLAPLVEDLDRIAPCFAMHGSQVEILDTPAAFYERLKTMIRSAERRIFLSTLYIGRSETELVAVLQETLRAKPGVRLHILTDALRGTREAPEAPSCAALLAPLVAEFGPGRVDVRMYHTPNLTGLRRRLVPKRINEGWGLQHMKLYGVDDAVLLSGANLSSDYFTNRQDRYHVFASAPLTDWYWRLHAAVASLSFAVEPGGPGGFTLSWPETNAAPSPMADPKAFVAAATATLRGLLAPSRLSQHTTTTNPPDDNSLPPPDTRVYALAQLTQLLRPDSSTERPALAAVLHTLARPAYAGAAWTFTAGYFNPAPFLSDLLLNTVKTSPPSHGTVITAAPQANGFYRSPGVSGMLPDAYTFLAARFLREATAAAAGAVGDPPAIALCEWRRGTVGTPGGWSYHAKGLWVTLPGHTQPALTVVGSSNYTKRSYTLDLEANALVVTTNAALQARLGAEQAWLQTHAAPTTAADFQQPERRVRAHVRLAMWLVSVLGGAL